MTHPPSQHTPTNGYGSNRIPSSQQVSESVTPLCTNRQSYPNEPLGCSTASRGAATAWPLPELFGERSHALALEPGRSGKSKSRDRSVYRSTKAPDSRFRVLQRPRDQLKSAIPADLLHRASPAANRRATA